MDVNMNIANKPVDLGKSKSAGVDNLADPKNAPAREGDGDRDNRIGQSSANFSAAALQLAGTQVTPAISNQTQVSNSREAVDAVSRLVADSRNNPGQLQQVYSNVSAANARRLLA